MPSKLESARGLANSATVHDERLAELGGERDLPLEALAPRGRRGVPMEPSSPVSPTATASAREQVTQLIDSLRLVRLCLVRIEAECSVHTWVAVGEFVRHESMPVPTVITVATPAAPALATAASGSSSASSARLSVTPRSASRDARKERLRRLDPRGGLEAAVRDPSPRQFRRLECGQDALGRSGRYEDSATAIARSPSARS